VMANGLLALGTMSPSPVLAASCNAFSACICPSNPTLFCQSHTPAGCSLSSAFCLNGALASCSFGPAVICTYS
jgi:hypothetical protein